jgi:hypothetical protein
MTLRALLALVLAFATALVFAAPVAAQGKRPTVREELSEEARGDWDAARDLYADKNYSGALVQFQKVYDKTKNPRVLFNVGVCLKNLQRYARAISAWEKELTFRDKLPADEIKQLEQAVETVREYVTTLKVTANEPGATLYIKDEAVGETPFLAPVPIDVGEQKVRLEKKGFNSIEKTVNILRNTPAKISFELVPEGKKTAVRIRIAGAKKATIFMDGKELGEAPFEGQVPAGQHTFEAREDGYEVARQTSEVVFGKPFTLKLSLVEAVSEGKVKILTGHEDAVISIDGKVVGSGAWEGVLKAGGHQLEVTKDGYETYSTDLALSPEQERVVRVSLQVEKGKAWIYWTVTAVAVLAGGGVASYFVFRPSKTTEVTGTFDPGVVPTTVRF